MKAIKIKIIICIVFIIIFTAGCKDNKRDTSLQTPPDNESINVTDPVELQKLWEEYFYDAITTVCNTSDFKAPEEINPAYIAQFCCYKYAAEKGVEDLELASPGSTLRLFPLDRVLEYTNRYFNVKSLDLSKISEFEYDKEKHAFMFGFPTQKEYPSYMDKNSWGIHLDRVTRDSDGTINAVMVHYDTYDNRRITLKNNITLKKGEKGTLYFASGSREYVNNNLVAITGNYREFDSIKGFDGNLDEIFMVGEFEGKIILANTPYEDGSAASLLLVNPEGLNVEKKLELDENPGYNNVRQSGSRLVICYNDKVLAIGKNLEKQEEILLPKSIVDKINREQKYDAEGFIDPIFGGYDVSSDLTKIVYSDETGVKLYNMPDNSEKTLFQPVKATGKDLEDKLLKYYHQWAPRFVSGDKKTITVTQGYECIRGYTLCDLEKGTCKTIELISDSSFGHIRYDTGILAVNIPTYNQLTQTSGIETLYLDFKTGDISDINLEKPGETNYIRPDYFSYVGHNYASFITDKHDYMDYTNNLYYINRLDLKTMSIEPGIISVRAAEVHILGVLEDGRVVFWYNLNQSEKGICITK